MGEIELDRTLAAVGSAIDGGADLGDEGALAPGTRVGRYVLLGQVGTGNMGVVHAAHDPDLDRKVAVKLIRAREEASGGARLLREAQALARVSHPNIVAVFDVGVRGHQVWIAMEFVAGTTLRELFGRDPQRHARYSLTAAGLFLDYSKNLITDETLALLLSFDDRRIHVHRNTQNLGHVQSFARALSLARHDLLLMSDQDDVWLPERATLMRSALAHPNAWVVSTNSRYIDGEGNRINFDAEGVSASRSTHHFANICSIFTGRRRYYGCAMGLRREILPIVLPIPDFVESHDLWIALASNLARANLHLDSETLSRRVHGSNASIVTRPLRQKLWSRVIFLRSLALLLYRLMTTRGVASRPVPL